jgi:hypothetical protein
MHAHNGIHAGVEILGFPEHLGGDCILFEVFGFAVKGLLTQELKKMM